MSTYQIISTRSETYLDRLGNPIQGVKVAFEILPSGDVGEVRVPKMDAKLIDTEVMKYVAEYDKLQKSSA